MKFYTIFILLILFITIVQAEEALFYVSNAQGDTIFAVYPSGIKVKNEEGQKVFSASADSVRFYLNETETPGRGSRGGFAIGGVGSATRPTFTQYFNISPDSIRFYLKELEDPRRGSRGGFAIGGVGSADRPLNADYLMVDADSTRIYVEDSEAGFRVESMEEGNEGSLMNLTLDNYFIGHESGQGITNGKYNSFFGFNAGFQTEGGTEIYPGEWEGCNNIFIGYKSGFSNVTGYKNNFLGYRSGYSNTSGAKNTFIGNESGTTNSEGSYNSFYGYHSGILNDGSYNSFFGSNCGFYNGSGLGNTFIGSHSGSNYQSGSSNTFLGTASGHGGGNLGVHPSQFADGHRNTFIGYFSGYENLHGDRNVFIGYKSGYNETSSDKLYIDNTDTDTPLIYGNFASDTITINGELNVAASSPMISLQADNEVDATIQFVDDDDPINQKFEIAFNASDQDLHFRSDDNSGADIMTIKNGGNIGMGTTNPGSYRLYVAGSAYASGGWSSPSDRRFNKNIQKIENALEKVKKIEGFSYDWKTDENPEKGFPEGKHYGVIAQEIEKVIPEIVKENINGDKAVAYNEIIPILINAINEQQDIIDTLSERLSILEKK
ncbi:MAG: tail fiber domain-containing protein [Candidatus Cloacimonetes bacterium]|nr:tail fiber domain-containing protein [Candidatus Cloacimonadota bacterium]